MKRGICPLQTVRAHSGEQPSLMTTNRPASPEDDVQPVSHYGRTDISPQNTHHCVRGPWETTPGADIQRWAARPPAHTLDWL